MNDYDVLNVKYELRRWNNHTQLVETVQLPLEKIIIEADTLQLNIEDVGLILLNVARSELGLDELPKESIARM